MAHAKREGGRLDVVIADYRLPRNDNGIELIEHIQALGRDVPAILVTGDTSPRVLRQAKKCRCEILHKPLNTDALITLIRQLIEGDEPRD